MAPVRASDPWHTFKPTGSLHPASPPDQPPTPWQAPNMDTPAFNPHNYLSPQNTSLFSSYLGVLWSICEYSGFLHIYSEFPRSNASIFNHNEHTGSGFLNFSVFNQKISLDFFWAVTSSYILIPTLRLRSGLFWLLYCGNFFLLIALAFISYSFSAELIFIFFWTCFTWPQLFTHFYMLPF